MFTLLPNPRIVGSRTTADAKLKELWDNHFVDLRTQALLLDMTVYNPLLDFSCIVRMAAEMPASGGLLPLEKFITVRLYRDYTTADYVRIVAEVLVLLMVMRYTVLELKAMKQNGGCGCGCVCVCVCVVVGVGVTTAGCVCG